LNRTVPSRRNEPWYREAEQVERAQMAIVRRHGLVVQAGPFAGMTWVSQPVTGTVPPKLVGSYESEIAPAVERMIARRPRTVVNIGCGEGYYAVGFARRLPEATVYGFDIDERAQAACRDLAARNGVSVKVAGECTRSDLQSLLSDGGLVVIDCEGCEHELVDPALPPADWIIESHDFVTPGTTELLCDRLAPTHDVDRIEQSPRNPSDYPALEPVPPNLRAVAIAERRNPALTWLACTAHTR
jgi:SAM-dependent methyltransferase